MTPTDFCAALESLAMQPLDAARMLGVPPSTISRWRSGKRPVPNTVANFLAYVIATRSALERVLNP